MSEDSCRKPISLFDRWSVSAIDVSTVTSSRPRVDGLWCSICVRIAGANAASFGLGRDCRYRRCHRRQCRVYAYLTPRLVSTPEWFPGRGSMTEHKYGNGWGAVETRIAGALLYPDTQKN